MILVTLYILLLYNMCWFTYNNLGFEITYEYLSGGPEQSNGEIILKIKLTKWLLIKIIFP